MSETTMEKETLIVVDFVDSPDNFLDEIKEEVIKLVNMESANPAVQVGHLLFKGNYVHSIDTNLVFEVPQSLQEGETSACETGVENTSMPKEYVGKTTKTLEVKRAVLDKGEPSSDSSSEK